MTQKFIKQEVQKMYFDEQFRGKVHETLDYSIFKKLPGNRKVSLSHVKGLIKSMKKVVLDVPIIVNEQMQIVNGQHVFQARKELGLPILYIKRKGANTAHSMLWHSSPSTAWSILKDNKQVREDFFRIDYPNRDPKMRF